MKLQQEDLPDCKDEARSAQRPLICGLPDDISLSCLARIPRKYHARLKCVSRRWRDLVSSEEWYSYRKKHNLDETWIYALCRDKNEQIQCYVLDPNSSRRGWKLIQGIPSNVQKRKGLGFEVLGRKMYLLGGCGWFQDATDQVYCYDASMSCWTEAASLPIPRCFFACEVLDEKIYAIGGLGSDLNDPNTWDIFNPSTNTWNSYSDPNRLPGTEDSVVVDGKIHIRCSPSAISNDVVTFVYEPSNGSWRHGDADMASGWNGPAVVVEGELYVLDESSGTRLMMWRKERKEWVVVKRLSQLLTQPPCRVVAIGKRIFVVGKGLSTLMFDVDPNTNVGGVMAGSSIPKLTSDCHVMSCKLLAL